MSEVFTIGHSTYPIEMFLDLVLGARISILVDVRSKPFSRYNPHFNRFVLADTLAAHGVTYRYGGNALGGRTKISVEAALFKAKMAKVLELAGEGTVALMCSEKNPAQCHRAGKLCAWIHRCHPKVVTTHILEGGEVVDGREFEPQVEPAVWWHEFQVDAKPRRRGKTR
jgi:uncharacterized protein (DUF488 family)